MSVRASSAPTTVIHENGANQNTDGASKENKSAPPPGRHYDCEIHKA